MNSFQRAIKYIVMTFAVLLAAGIISGIATLIFGIATSFDFVKNTTHSAKTIDFSKSYTSVTALNITNGSGVLEIKTGDTFQVVASDVSDRFSCKNLGGVLTVNGVANISNFLKGNGKYVPQVIVYLPENFVADTAVVKNGAGKITIDKLYADDFKLEVGAGAIEARNIKAAKTDIDGGVGKTDLDNVRLTNLDYDGGVGKTTINGEILGSSQIECGVGEFNLQLKGSTDNYNLKIEKGLGQVTIDGQKYSGANWNNSNAQNSLNIEAGVGAVNIDFNK